MHPVAQWRGQREITFEQQLLGVACIAGEQFVAAVTCEHPRDAGLARQQRALIRCGDRGIAERFVRAAQQRRA